MVIARSTVAKTSDRIDVLEGMIVAGTVNTVCLAFARKDWSISRARGFELMMRSWTHIKDDVDETGDDRFQLLAYLTLKLMSAAGYAKQSNPFLSSKDVMSPFCWFLALLLVPMHSYETNMFPLELVKK